MKSKRLGRRRFLKTSAALAGLGVGGVRSASSQKAETEIPDAPVRNTRAYGVRSRFVTSVRGPAPFQYSPIQDSMGTMTPAPLHFVIGTGGIHIPGQRPISLPDIDPRQHRLLIHGMVDRPLILTMDDMMRLPSVSRHHFIQCSGVVGGSKDSYMRFQNFSKGNSAGNTRYWYTSSSEWTGVPLSVLLKEVGIQKGASWVVAEGVETDRMNRSIPLEKAMYDCIVAYGQNGEPVRPEQGYPLRLVVPGFEGNINVKWLGRIKVVDQPAMTYNENTNYTSLRPDGKARWFQFEMPPFSLITFPSGGQQLNALGFYEIRGLAWSGSGAIRRVEVSTDGGRSWKDASLQEPVHRMAHARFRFPWNWDGQEALIQSRCTDEEGQVQPTLDQLGKIWGVKPDYWQTTTNAIKHFNPIYPWKVTREGSVQNALFE